MDAFWYRKGATEKVSAREVANNIHKIFHSKDGREKIWIDIFEPTTQDYHFLKTFFDIHPRTLENIRRSSSRPQLEEYDKYIFAVLYGLDDHGHFTQLSFLVGENYLISIHHRRINSFELVKKDLPLVNTLLSKDSEFVMHALIESEAGKYLPLLERFDSQIATIEERVLSERSSALVNEIFHIKHQLITLKHHLVPQKDALYQLSRRGVKFIMPTCADHFRDVYMETVSSVESIDNYRDILTGLLDVHLSVVSNHLNDIIKLLTVVSIIFLPLTLIASIYGMNFTYMPELGWRYGYFLSIGVMVLLTAVMLYIFRKLKWI